MEADVREAQENEATHRQVAVNAIAEAQCARAATGKAVLWSAFTTCVSIGCVLYVVLS